MKHYCKDCKIKEISSNTWRIGKGRCMPCACLFRYKDIKRHPRYIGGLPHCIDCDKELTHYNKNNQQQRCRKCYNKSRSKRHYFCIDCNKEISRHSKIGKGRCMKCSGDYFSGNNSWNWFGGKIRFTTRIRTNGKYKLWRRLILKRDHKKCQMCNKSKKHLHAHHKIPLRSILVLYAIKTYKQFLRCKLLWDVNWGITLCQKCHNSLGILK